MLYIRWRLELLRVPCRSRSVCGAWPHRPNQEKSMLVAYCVATCEILIDHPVKEPPSVIPPRVVRAVLGTPALLGPGSNCSGAEAPCSYRYQVHLTRQRA